VRAAAARRSSGLALGTYRGSLFLGLMLFTAVSFVSGLVTFIIMWFGNGVWYGRVAGAIGFACGLAISGWIWFYDEPPHYGPGPHTYAIACLIGAIIGPRWVLKVTSDPNWIPPERRD